MAYINDKGQEVLSSETRVIRVPFQARELSVFDRVRMLLEERYVDAAGDFESDEDSRNFGSDSDFDDDITVQESPAQFYDRVMTEPQPPRDPDPGSDPDPSDKMPEATE